jgi:hypothetical protein
LTSKPSVLKSSQLQPQQFIIPTCREGELIVGDHISALLCFAEMIEHDDRHFGELQFPCRQETTVAGDHARMGVHQNRIVKTKG